MMRMRVLPAIAAACFALLPTAVISSSENLVYFAEAHVDVDTIAVERTARIGAGYEVKAIYAYPKGTAYEGHFVGVFLIKDGSLNEVLDMVPSPRGLDFFPSIRIANKVRIVISFESDYGELDKREYVLDLRRDKKLVEVVHLTSKRSYGD